MKKTVLYLLIAMTGYGASVMAANKEEPLLHNGSFELPKLEGATVSMLNPDDWNVYATKGAQEKVGISTKRKRSGMQSMIMQSQGKDDAFQGVWVPVPVEERERYQLELYVTNDPDRPMKGNHQGQVSIEWKDGEGIEIARDLGPDWNQSLSKKSWKRKRMIVSAPVGAKLARVVITFNDGLNSEPGGSFYVDDVEFRER
jgi:hypothetical protein